MIRGYFDDSSDRSQSEYFSVGGFVTPINYRDAISIRSGWDHLELLWMDATSELREPFRSTDCETQHGQFENWNKRDCDALMAKLTALVVKAPIVLFASVVPVQDFRDCFPNMTDRFAPYTLAVQTVIATLANYGHKEGHDIEIIFEDSTATSATTHESFRKLRTLSGWTGASRLSRISFEDKHFMALQPADLIAREAFKHFDNIHTPRRMRKPLEKMIGKFAIRCWTPQAFRRLRDDLGWPNSLHGLAREAGL